jgi:hypothetical protein
MRIRKADQPAFDEAFSTTLLAVTPQVKELRDALCRAMDHLLAGDCPDHLMDPVRREVMNEIGRELFEPLLPPLVPPTD